MATLVSSSLIASNSSDANFRGWATFIRDIFITTGGWVQTSDTGQMNFATVTAPIAANAKQGYIVVRMNDALQSTSPVFVRIDFGSGSGVAQTPGIWITIGTGSDGIGNITNKRFDGGATATATIFGSNSAVTNSSYGSAAPNRIQFALFVRATNFVLSLERSKDATGADTGDGIIIIYNASTTQLNNQRYIILGQSAQPPVEAGIQYIISSNNPSSFGGDVGVALPVPMKGYAQPPGNGLLIVRSSDFTTESLFTVNIYGTTYTYQHVGSTLITINLTGGADSNARICIRFD